MPKVSIVYLSKSAYARTIGVSEKAVRKAIADGKIKKGWDADKQKVIKHLADKEYGHLHSITKPRPGVSKEKLTAKMESESATQIRTKKVTKSELEKTDGKNSDKSDEDEENEDGDLLFDLADIKLHSGLSYAESSRRKAIIELALEKKKLEELEGSLVRKDDVEKALYSFGSQLKKSLLSVPQRVIEDVLAAPNRVESLNVLTAALVECLDVYANLSEVKINK